MIHLRFAIGFLAGAMLASTAFAQDRGTEAEQEACTPDVFRLCQEYIPNEASIVDCLKLNRARLSPACVQVFAVTEQTPHRFKRKRRRHRDD